MYELRQRAAQNAGFANFRDYIFPAKFRFDYTPADCERFHDAVERPSRRRSSGCWSPRRQRLGLDVLRPWDLAVDPYRPKALRPFADCRRAGEHGHAACSTGLIRCSAASSRP